MGGKDEQCRANVQPRKIEMGDSNSKDSREKLASYTKE